MSLFTVRYDQNLGQSECDDGLTLELEIVCWPALLKSHNEGHGLTAAAVAGYADGGVFEVVDLLELGLGAGNDRPEKIVSGREGRDRKDVPVQGRVYITADQLVCCGAFGNARNERVGQRTAIHSVTRRSVTIQGDEHSDVDLILLQSPNELPGTA
jgi:hypothetical protein